MMRVLLAVLMLLAACAPRVKVITHPGVEEPVPQSRQTIAGVKPELKTGPIQEEREGPPAAVERVPLPKRQHPSPCPPAMAPSCR